MSLGKGMIKFDSDICTNFVAASSREWLETNGIGGFASGTISGANMRRYHGILTAATKPPLGRVTMVSKLEACDWSRSTSPMYESVKCAT